ncbi:MAG: hypothetical protein WDO74_16905 [Pseudomonadota bacterium]
MSPQKRAALEGVTRSLNLADKGVHATATRDLGREYHFASSPFSAQALATK